MTDRPWTSRKQARARRILKRAEERPVQGPTQFLVPLRVGEELSVSRALDVRVVRGHVEAWGACLGASSAFRRVVAPPWGALPRLRAEAPEALGEEATGEPSPTAGEEEDDDVRKFLARRSWPVVLCARLVPSEEGGSLQIAAAGEEGSGRLDALRATLAPPEELPRLRAHLAWPSLVEHFATLARSASAERPPVMLVAGAKNVGKSTCCRYFVNALWSAFGEVYFLETDLGQPELTPPGLVSLHRVSGPLLSFSQAGRSSEPASSVVSFFAGATTAAAHPSLYARSVRAAFEAYLDMCRSCKSPTLPPLVVNSHGWLTGLGLELVSAVLAAVQPQLVIRIRSVAAASTPEDGGSEEAETGSGSPTSGARGGRGDGAKRKRSMLARCGPLSRELQSAAHADSLEESSVLIDVDSIAKPSSTLAARRPIGGPVAVELRWLRFASCFRSDLDPCRPPSSGLAPRDFFGPLPRLRLPLAKLRFGLALAGSPPPASEVEAAFIGAVAALCHAEEAEESRVHRQEDAAMPATFALRDGVVARCVATAFVHSFDFPRGELVVYTSKLLGSVDSINVVLRGDLHWEPHSVRGQRVSVEPAGAVGASPMQPFCSSWVLEGLAAGARATSTRTNLKRKRGQKLGAP